MSKSKDNIAKHYLVNRKKAKLYILAKQGVWADLATGFVFIKKQPPFYLTMIHEVCKSVVFKLSLTSKVKFHLQHNTIISWKESPELTHDNYALSFQDVQGVKDIWGMISLLKGDDAKEVKENSSENVLPEVTLDNLELIAKEIQPETDKAQKLLCYIKQSNCLFIFQLGKLFEEEEKKINEEKLVACSKETSLCSEINIENKNTSSHLSSIYAIIKNIILIADIDLLEKLMNEHICPIIFGALEYDVESTKVIKHRQYLTEVANFNNILVIQDDNIRYKIKMNYLLMYLKDSVLARFLNRNGMIIINRLIQMNNIDIIQFFIYNKADLEKVAMQIINDDIDIQYKAILFINEFINCSKDLFIHLNYFQELLCQCGVIKAIEFLLMKVAYLLSKTIATATATAISISISNETVIVQQMILCKLIEILSVLISNMPLIIKDHMMNKVNWGQEGQSFLLMSLSSIIKTEQDFGIKSEIGNIISKLVDVTLYQGDIDIKHHPIFTYCLNDLSEFLLIDINRGNINYKKSMSQSKEAIIELLSHCLNNKNECMPYWVIDNNIIDKVLFALKDKNKSLMLSVLKFIKSMIESNNEDYHKAVILSGCLDTLIELFNANKAKDNLWFSRLMSLFDCLIKDDNFSHLFPSMHEKFNETIFSRSNQKYFQSSIGKYKSIPHSVKENTPSLIEFEPISNNTNDAHTLHNEIQFDDDDDDEYAYEHKNTNITQSSRLFAISNSSRLQNCNKRSIAVSNGQNGQITPTFLGKKHYQDP